MSYDEIWLDGNLKQMETVFYCFVEKEPYSGHDFFSLADTFMRTSPIRQKMDGGSWSAMNKGSKQILHSISLDGIAKRTNIPYPDALTAGWMGKVYSMMQWKYDVTSLELSQLIPARELYTHWMPLNEVSLNMACEMLHEKYF